MVTKSWVGSLGNLFLSLLAIALKLLVKAVATLASNETNCKSTFSKKKEKSHESLRWSPALRCLKISQKKSHPALPNESKKSANSVKLWKFCKILKKS